MTMQIVRIIALIWVVVLPHAVVERWVVSPSVQDSGVVDVLQVLLIWAVLRLVRNHRAPGGRWPWWRLTHSAPTSAVGFGICVLAVCVAAHYAATWGAWPKSPAAIIAMSVLAALFAHSWMQLAFGRAPHRDLPE
ncbi:hypothetical protein ACL9RL_03450 [Plantibacter sp. Mn2098]|uniref:hypothetical protein n=1 Tax=Plantibacter sp. Mn2098 TaxID=3395266 RepID=UPI003BDB18DE